MSVVVHQAGQVQRQPGEHPLPVQVDGVGLKVGHLDEEILVELLWNCCQELHGQSLFTQRFNVTLELINRKYLKFVSVTVIVCEKRSFNFLNCP